MIRNDYTRDEIAEIYRRPILELIYEAATVHRQYHDPSEVQMSTLLSVKTGGCPEDCAYCPQAARYQTGVKGTALMKEEEILEAAARAKDGGSSRFCMGAAWREVKDNSQFDRIVSVVEKVNAMGIEVCCTLGMLNAHQAQRLKDAGLHSYNHNIYSSPEYYSRVISTRGFDDRLNTLGNVRKAGLKVCSGGIVGMGETEEDRIGFLHVLSTLEEHPESVPINTLVAVEGTPLEEQEKIPFWEMLRTIATARILMPASMVRLSAGRLDMSESEQAFCFLAGANSIFAGDKLLTTPNPAEDKDKALMSLLGLKPRPAFKDAKCSKSEEAVPTTV
jgi:biotin synthase